ncbi:MAG: hypothetical protein ACHQNT_06910 [Bacteroidia bacterium]
MVKAGALFYAIAVSLLIAMVSSAFIFYSLIQSLRFASNNISERLLLNANSGINILMSENGFIPMNKKTTLDLFNDGTDSVTLERKDWGGFEIFSSVAFSGNNRIGKTALIGYDYFDSKETALYLCDLGKPLSLCGKTLIKGTCFLPKSGVKRAYIEGQNFTGDKLIDGTIKLSTSQLPPVNKELINRLKDIFIAQAGETDSIVNFEESEIPDTITRSFSESTLFIYSKENMLLSGKNLSGNILLYSKKNIRVESNNEMHDVLLFASSVSFEENFTGTVQAFASDSIIVKSSCRIKYPSVLGIIQEKNSADNLFIRLEKDAQITGILFASQDVSTTEKNITIYIQKNSEFSGQLYSSGNADIQGSVFGSVFCKKIMLRTPSSIYENHLLNATIDNSRLSVHFTGISLVEQSKNKKIVKWLY